MMDWSLVYQPEYHFRFFDLIEESKEFNQSINNYDQIPLVTLEQAVEPLKDLIPHVIDMVKLVKEKCLRPANNLSADESASIMLYTIEWIPKENSFYYIFNRILKKNDQNQLISCYSYFKLISTALIKLPRLSKRIFYRGIQADLKNQYSVNKIVNWYGYTSCSSSLDIYDKEKFSFDDTDNCTLFIIHSENGIDISKHSYSSIKSEVLLSPNQQFQVVSSRQSNNGLCIIILKELSINETISSIILNNNKQTKSFDILFEKSMKKFEKYSEINLKNQNITDYHMNIIIKYGIKKKKCSWLSLQNNQITSLGLIILSNELEHNTSLETLYLSQNFITDLGIESLAKILSNNHYTNLTFLSLDHNSIKDYGALCLANMLRVNRILTDLWLSYNQIGNDGLQVLIEVLTFDNNTLIQLYLNGNKFINDLSIKCLMHMFKLNRKLNKLWLQDCNFTQEGKDKLEKMDKYVENFDLYV